MINDRILPFIRKLAFNCSKSLIALRCIYVPCNHQFYTHHIRTAILTLVSSFVFELHHVKFMCDELIPFCLMVHMKWSKIIFLKIKVIYYSSNQYLQIVIFRKENHISASMIEKIMIRWKAVGTFLTYICSYNYSKCRFVGYPWELFVSNWNTYVK